MLIIYLVLFGFLTAQATTASAATFTDTATEACWPGALPWTETTGPSPPPSTNNFGSSVDTDGTRVIVGDYTADSFRGAAYIFIWDTFNYTYEAKLVAPTRHFFTEFGHSSSISGDWAIVGESEYDTNRGMAHMFFRENGTWVYFQNFSIPGAAINTFFASDVAIDDTRLLIGRYGADRGEVYAYEYNATANTWESIPFETPSSLAVSAAFGVSVVLDDTRALVGAPTTTDLGQAFSFDFNTTTRMWNETAELTPTSTVNVATFGKKVVLQGDTALVGAPFSNVLGSNAGAAYAFTFNNSATTWTQTTNLLTGDTGTGDQYGRGLSIFGDIAAVSAPTKNSLQGAVYLFGRSGSTWSNITKLTASDGASWDTFGNAVSIGTGLVLVGAPGNSDGTVYAYRPDACIPITLTAASATQASITATASATATVASNTVTQPSATATAASITATAPSVTLASATATAPTVTATSPSNTASAVSLTATAPSETQASATATVASLTATVQTVTASAASLTATLLSITDTITETLPTDTDTAPTATDTQPSETQPSITATVATLTDTQPSVTATAASVTATTPSATLASNTVTVPTDTATQPSDTQPSATATAASLTATAPSVTLASATATTPTDTATQITETLVSITATAVSLTATEASATATAASLTVTVPSDTQPSATATVASDTATTPSITATVTGTATAPSDTATIVSVTATAPSNTATATGTATVPSNTASIPSITVTVPSDTETLPTATVTMRTDTATQETVTQTEPTITATVPSDTATIPSNTVTQVTLTQTEPTATATLPSDTATVPSNTATAVSLTVTQVTVTQTEPSHTASHTATQPTATDTVPTETATSPSITETEPTETDTETTTEVCLLGETYCTSAEECIDLSIDPHHCGACDNGCPVYIDCVLGICKVLNGSCLANGVCQNILAGDDSPAGCTALSTKSCAHRYDTLWPIVIFAVFLTLVIACFCTICLVAIGMRCRRKLQLER